MARRTYFAFHYQNDIVRVNQVRNSDVTKADREQAGFYDNGLWESSRKTGDEAIKKMIRSGLDGSSVTVFLLGEHTATRPWVRFELEESWNRGNGLLSIRIHGLHDFNKQTSRSGEDILEAFTIKIGGIPHKLSNYFKTYDWILHSGYKNFGKWVDEASAIAEKLKAMR